jgi:hypothetical protein
MMYSLADIVRVIPEYRTDRPDNAGVNACISNADGGDQQRYGVRYVISRLRSPRVKASRLRSTINNTYNSGETGLNLSRPHGRHDLNLMDPSQALQQILYICPRIDQTLRWHPLCSREVLSG